MSQPSPAPRPQTTGLPRIVVRAPNWVGDAVMSTPALAHLRACYPDAHLVVLCRPWVAAIYAGNPHVSELWVEDDSASAAAFVKAVLRVRRGRFHLGVLLPNAFRAALLLTLGGVARRIGYAGRGRSWMLHQVVPIAPELRELHQVYFYLHLIETLTAKRAGVPRLELYPGEAEREQVRRLLAQWGLDRGQPLVGIAPGSINSDAKRWLPERFAELADRLQASGAAVLLLGSPREQDVLDRVAARCRTKVSNLGGQLGLGELIALCERLQGMICNDAGAMHIAAAMRVPTVAIFGPTDWSTTYPFSHAARIVRHHVPCAPCMLRQCPLPGHPCMAGVTVEQVAAAFRTVVEAARRPSNQPPQPVFG